MCVGGYGDGWGCLYQTKDIISELIQCLNGKKKLFQIKRFQGRISSHCFSYIAALKRDLKLAQDSGLLMFFYAPQGTPGGILKSHRPSVRPSVRPSGTNRVSAISHKLLKQI